MRIQKERQICYVIIRRTYVCRVFILPSFEYFSELQRGLTEEVQKVFHNRRKGCRNLGYIYVEIWDTSTLSTTCYVEIWDTSLFFHNVPCRNLGYFYIIHNLLCRNLGYFSLFPQSTM